MTFCIKYKLKVGRLTTINRSNFPCFLCKNTLILIKILSQQIIYPTHQLNFQTALANLSTNQLVSWFAGLLFGCVAGFLIGWLGGWMDELLNNWMVGRFAGRLVGYLVGWLVS